MARNVVRKPVTLRPIRPNAGLELRFRRRLDAEIAAMHASLIHWLSAAYRADPSALLAQDAPDGGGHHSFTRRPGDGPIETMRRLKRQWQVRFDRLAPELADYFGTAIKDRSDAALKAALKKAGMTVEWKMTEPMREVMQATVGEQVGLIKSIAQEHLTQVEGLVMRSVAQGRDLKTLTDDLEARYGITRRRAAFIARDQNNKATATLTRVRQEELGITKAIWMHSHGGKHPRPSHKANDGKEYDIKTGWYDPDAKEWCWPGTLINCRCVSRSVIPGF